MCGKALKAVLMARQVYFRRTHDLDEITALLEGAKLTLPFDLDVYRSLTPYAVELRYDEIRLPGIDLDSAESIAQVTLKWAQDQVGSV